MSEQANPDGAGRTVAGSRPWRPVRGARASAEVVEQIKDAFFAGLAPGDWLGTENELAERFGVSRITIRDAIRTLEAYGIVDVKVGARGGLRVAEANPDRFVESLAIQLRILGVTWDEVIELRDAVEPLAAALAAQRRTDEQLTRLRKLTDDARKAVAAPNEFTALALEFHLALAEASGNRVLYATLLALRGTGRRHHAPRATLARARRIARLHAQILDAVRDADAPRAGELMRQHMRLIKEGPGSQGAELAGRGWRR